MPVYYNKDPRNLLMPLD